MNVLDFLDDKIKDLDTSISPQEINGELLILNHFEIVLESDEMISNHDFTDLFDLLNKYEMIPEELLGDVKKINQIIEVRKRLHTNQIPFPEELISSLKKLKDTVTTLKQRITLEEKKSKNKDKVKNLTDLKEVFTGTGKRKYYTGEMYESFSDVVDWENLSDEEFTSIMDKFYDTGNFRTKQSRESIDLDEVINLFKEYLPSDEFNQNKGKKFTGLFGLLIKKYSLEISQNIDLDNAREILEFFKDKGILSKFKRPALLMICVYAKSDYVKEIYEQKFNKDDESLEIYFEDELASIWVCDSTVERKNPFRVTKAQGEEKGEKSLYSMCHTVTEEDFWNNVEHLNRNADMFPEKYDASLFGSHLKAKTLPTDKLDEFIDLLRLVTSSSWSFVKDLELFKTFKIGDIYKVPISCFSKGDLEKKIHLAIELGLLNPPMSEINKTMDKEIHSSDKFMNLRSQKGISNNSIRNYFQRNISVLAVTSVNEFGFLTKRLNDYGQLGFYNYFFSERMSGDRAVSDIRLDMEENMPDKDEFIDSNFITSFYDQYVENYDEYDVVISDYDESIRKETGISYFDESILDDELIRRLEENNSVIDSLTQNDNQIEARNEFVYKFGDRLISRYKVLHNASILKGVYGSLDKEMLLASIVRDSFLSEDDFNVIKESLKERNLK